MKNAADIIGDVIMLDLDSATSRQTNTHTEKVEMDYIYKPCPFCGSTKIKHDKCTSRVRCGKCFASGPMIGKFLIDGVNEEQAAVNSWNRRVQEYATDDARGKR